MSTREWIVISFDTRTSKGWVSAECQLGAHHGCPGGTRDEAYVRVLVCRCPNVDCGCSRPRPKASRTPGPS